MKVLIPDHYPDGYLERMRAISSEVDIVRLQRSDGYYISRGLWWLFRNYLPYNIYRKCKPALDRALQKNWYAVGKINEEKIFEEIEVMLYSAMLTPDILSEYLPKLRQLRWIHSTHTGIDHLFSSNRIKSDVIVTNIGHINSRRVAEFVVALVLYGAKNIATHDGLQRKKKWHGVSSKELGETTLGILGLGSIGQQVARMASSLNINVIATKRNPIEMENVTVLPQDKYHEVLKVADYIAITLPLTRDTEGMIGENELRMMKKKACLINVSRGKIIQEDALLTALREKWIAGAYLDVFSDEPLTKNSPFYSLKNVLITHHSSYASQNSMIEIFDVFLENLRRYISGEPLLNVVSRERGY